jgi:hypothetical protein
MNPRNRTNLLFQFRVIFPYALEKENKTRALPPVIRAATAKHLSTWHPHDLWRYYLQPATLSIK